MSISNWKKYLVEKELVVNGKLSYVREPWVKLSGINIVKYGENLNLI